MVVVVVGGSGGGGGVVLQGVGGWGKGGFSRVGWWWGVEGREKKNC